MIVHKCIDAVEEVGSIKAGLLSTRFNLPMPYMSNASFPTQSQRVPSSQKCVQFLPPFNPKTESCSLWYYSHVPSSH